MLLWGSRSYYFNITQQPFREDTSFRNHIVLSIKRTARQGQGPESAF